MASTITELPGSATAATDLRRLQLGGSGGLQGLMMRDTGDQRSKIQKAMFDQSAEGISRAADLQRQSMLEGTFARGVGPSSITVDLAGRLGQEYNDAMARAGREAYIGAGSEERADLASQLGLYDSAFDRGTTGLQAEANVGQANASREQQGSQFDRSLAQNESQFGRSLSQQNSQFGQNLGLQYAQLAQSGSQFDKNLAFQGTQSDLNRELARWTQNDAQEFNAGENAATRSWTSGENAANRALTTGENAANRDLARWQTTTGQTFTGEQNDLTRALQKYLAESGQTFQGDEADANRALTLLLTEMQLEQQQNLSNDRLMAGGIASGIGGAANLTDWLLNYLKS